MAKTLAQLKAEIDKLQAEASALHDKERKEVIGRIKEAIASYGLTAADLGLTGRRAGGPSGTAEVPRKGARRGRGSSAKKSTGAVKYRDDQGNSWTGHGRRPNWFVQALANGKTEADLRA
jgi:DNA-binding protein H-NS